MMHVKQILAVLIFSLLVPVYAFADTLTLSTDKTSYLRGQVMKVTAVYKRNDGTPITSPRTREIRIKNPSGTQVLQTSMVSAGSGVYTYSYTLSSSAPTGTWEVRGKFAYNGVETRKYTYPRVSSTTSDLTAPITTASPAAGTYSSAQSVTLASNEPAVIYYTTDGTTPVYPVAGTTRTYSAPISIAASTTLKYFSRDTAGNKEAVKSATYTIYAPAGDTTAPATTATPAAGTYTSAQSVALSSNEPAVIYYTTDGTTPVYPVAGTTRTYSAPISIATSTTLRYFSRDTAGNKEAVKSATYTITAATTKTHDPNNTTLVWSGYRTCLGCHRTQSADMYQGVHYQWQASGAKMTTGPAIQGKMDALDGSSALNAYCINIIGGWKACGTCHAGTGAKPVATATPSDAQLSSIDCLMCHGSASAPYSRARNAATGLFEPTAGVDMNQVVRSVVKPARNNCLSCHAKAGGGDAVKRGDLALASGATSDALYDVHMATSRGNLTCQSCHKFTSHKVAGRGSDLRPLDSAVAVSCSSTTCHANKNTLASGHASADVNHHMKRVACQTCHLPRYAKNANDTAATEATETHRDWEGSEWNVSLNRYEPLPTKANDLVPRYAFWNGTSWGNNLNDVAVIDPLTGNYKISRPVGAINDPTSKIYPFKYKTARQPLDTTTGRLIGLNTATFFATGNYVQSVQDGLAGMGRSGDAWQTVTSDEYQVLNHQIPPAAGNALACSACHPNSTATAMKLITNYGYGTTKPMSDLCNDCHGTETYPGYKSFHDKHVTSKRYDCSRCHNFSRKAERGLN